MAIKRPHLTRKDWNAAAHLMLLFGSLSILVGPTAYGIASFVSSDSKGRDIGEIFIGIRFFALAVGLLLSICIFAEKQCSMLRDRAR